MAIEVSQLESSDMAAWDRFVHQSQQATFFHRSAWKGVLEEAFGHRCFFLKASVDGAIRGILPLAYVKSFIFGNSLTSLPFCVYGGVVADTPEINWALRQKAQELAEDLKVGALELRSTVETESDWPVKELYVTFKKEILEDDEANLMAIPNRQRAMIRKGQSAGLVSEWDSDVDRLYKVYAESVRNLGTPVFSRKYLKILKKHFGDDCSVLMIRSGDSDVAGVMNFYFRNEVLPYYGGSTSGSRQIKGVNDFMYWELMRRSREQGVTCFDFGRSKKGTGAYKFKKNWRFTPQDLPYEYFLVKSGEVPELNPSNPKYKLLIEGWSRLPLPVANTLGPLLARSLG